VHFSLHEVNRRLRARKRSAEHELLHSLSPFAQHPIHVASDSVSRSRLGTKKTCSRARRRGSSFSLLARRATNRRIVKDSVLRWKMMPNTARDVDCERVLFIIPKPEIRALRSAPEGCIDVYWAAGSDPSHAAPERWFSSSIVSVWLSALQDLRQIARRIQRSLKQP
jgi:hypothetical protein